MCQIEYYYFQAVPEGYKVSISEDGIGIDRIYYGVSLWSVYRLWRALHKRRVVDKELHGTEKGRCQIEHYLRRCSGLTGSWGRRRAYKSHYKLDDRTASLMDIMWGD